MLIAGDDCFTLDHAKFRTGIDFTAVAADYWFGCLSKNSAWENEDSGFINTQTNTLYGTKSKDQCLLRLLLQLQRENTNMLEPLETKPESASNPLQLKQAPMQTHAHT